MKNFGKKLNIGSKAESGFTLIELCITLVIFGSIIGLFAALYTQQIRPEADKKTRINVSNAVAHITNYRALYGHYPCPASLTASMNNPTISASPTNAVYGVATDCTATTGDYSLGTGLTSVGIIRVLSSRVTEFEYINRDTGVRLPQRPVIRIGALPYRTLNIDEADSYDGYRNRLFYAVTEQLTDNMIFNVAGGGITILNEENESAIDPPNTGHFVIFSAGENELGAFTAGGNIKTPCPPLGAGGGLELNNCNLTQDTIFVSAKKASGAGSTEGIDDIIAYSSHHAVGLWEKNRDINSPRDISAKILGNVGIGVDGNVNVSLAPREELDVGGRVRIQDETITTDQTESRLFTERFCQKNPTTGGCIKSSLFAGDLAQGTGGMKCPLLGQDPSFKYMIGIAQQRPICTDKIEVACPVGTNLVGVKENGDLDCQWPPCEGKTVSVCDGFSSSATRNLPRSKVGTTFDLTANGDWGDILKVTYTCTGAHAEEPYSRWVESSNGGYCEPCVDSSVVTTPACSLTNMCGGSFGGGTMTVTTAVVCPNRTPVITTDMSACSNTANCNPGSGETIESSCPAGFNAGNILTTSRLNCATLACEVEETVDTCSCSEQTKECGECPTGYALVNGPWGTDTFQCPGGSDEPGGWTGCVQNPSAECVCQVPTPNFSELTLPCTGSGLQCGDILQTTTYACVNNALTTTTTELNRCTAGSQEAIPFVDCDMPTGGVKTPGVNGLGERCPGGSLIPITPAVDATCGCTETAPYEFNKVCYQCPDHKPPEQDGSCERPACTPVCQISSTGDDACAGNGTSVGDLCCEARGDGKFDNGTMGCPVD